MTERSGRLGWPAALALVFLIFITLFAGQCTGCVKILDKCACEYELQPSDKITVQFNGVPYD